MQHVSTKKPKSVRSLYGRHQDETIYVVGSGASMRVFPADFLAGKVTIGLNMAWKAVPVTYGITIHPDLNIPEFMDGEEPQPEITWITKLDKSRKFLETEQLAHALEHFLFFRNDGQANTSNKSEPSNAGRILDWVKKPTDDYLYVWSSIAQPAVNLAANMGAKHIVMVGCDNCDILGNHHGHKQHTRWLLSHPNDRYREYYEGMLEVREALVDRGVDLVSVTPFLGLNNYEEDFVRLCQTRGKESYIRADNIVANPLPVWVRALRGHISQLVTVLGLVEEMRAFKRRLGMK